MQGQPFNLPSQHSRLTELKPLPPAEREYTEEEGVNSGLTAGVCACVLGFRLKMLGFSSL